MRTTIWHTMVFTILTIMGLLLANTGLAGQQGNNQKRSTRNCGGCGAKASKKTAGGAKSRQSEGGGAGGKSRLPTPASACGPGCCARNVTTHIEVPPDVSRFIVTCAWDHVVLDPKLGGGPDLDDCPLHVSVIETEHPTASLAEPHYAFHGTLSVMQATGRYTLNMELVDLIHGDDTWVFSVGRGTIELEYKAPNECKRKQTETVTVFNSCNTRPNQNWYPPEQEVATTEFDVMCIRGKFEFQYDSEIVSQWGVTVKDGYEHSAPFSVNFDEDPPSIEGEGKYSTTLNAKKGTLGGSSRMMMSEKPGGYGYLTQNTAH